MAIFAAIDIEKVNYLRKERDEYIEQKEAPSLIRGTNLTFAYPTAV